MSRKELRGLVVGRLEGHPFDPGGDLAGSEVRQHFFCGHVPGEFIPGHRAAAEALYGPVKAPATGLEGSVDFFKPATGM